MKKTITFLTISILAHIFLIMLLIILEMFGISYFKNFHNRWVQKELQKKKITITRIVKNKINKAEIVKEQEKLKNKNVGKEDGVKNIFSAPINKKLSNKESDSGIKNKNRATPFKTTSSPASPTSPASSTPSLSSLRIVKNDGKYLYEDKRRKKDQIVVKQAIDRNKTEKILREMQFERDQNKTSSNILSYETKSNQLYLPNSLSSLRLNKEDLSVLPSLQEEINLNLRFEVPHGVSFDKLNDEDLKFYSFNLRVFRSYILAVFKSYEDFKRENPHVDLSTVEKQVLVASVVYNLSGKIERISFIQSSNNDKVQAFFQRALEQNNVFNPPKEIIQNGHFYLNYQLIINP
ncbi:MAG: hypothetical protein HQK51_12855 [Oligoflexia bacterium]|nr:hypothetical protein [Oligoflexia bacterium]